MDLVTAVSLDAEGTCSILIRILCVILVYTMGISKSQKRILSVKISTFSYEQISSVTNW